MRFTQVVDDFLLQFFPGGALSFNLKRFEEFTGHPLSFFFFQFMNIHHKRSLQSVLVYSLFD